MISLFQTTSFSLSIVTIFATGFIAGLVLSETTGSIRQAPSRYSQPCNESISCNSSAGLTCFSGRCTCIFSETMKFNEEKFTCEVLPKKPCVVENPVSLLLKEDGGSGSTLLEVPSEKKLPCVKNSYCDEDSKICVCNEDFKLRNDQCVPKSTVGEECLSSAECKEGESLTCVNKSCICDPEKSMPIQNTETVDRCVGKAGHSCVRDQCVDGARCVESRKSALTTNISTALLASPESQVCDCLPGTYTTRNGTCSRGHGVKCDTSNPCKPWLICEADGYCACKNDQIYDKSVDICVALIWSSCNKNVTSEDEKINEDEIICTDDANCMPNPRFQNESSGFESPMVCICNDGFNPAYPERICVADGNNGLQPEHIIVCTAIIVLLTVVIGTIVFYCCLKNKGRVLANAFG